MSNEFKAPKIKLWYIDYIQHSSEKVEKMYNGSYTERYKLPYFWCCGIRGENGFVTTELPARFRDNPLFDASRETTISHVEFLKARDLLLKDSTFVNVSPESIRRGYEIAPVIFDPPSKKSDFLWCVAGSMLIVSDRVHASMKVYAGEDFISLELSHSYWMVIPSFACLPPVERRGGSVCPLCGLNENYRNKSEFLFEEDMIIDHEIFTIKSTGRIVITSRFKKILNSLKPINVVFKKVNFR